MAVNDLGTVGIGREDGVGSPKNRVTVGSNNHATLLLASNLYIEDGNNDLKIAGDHSTMAGAAVMIPGNGQPRQNHIEFWTTRTKNVTADEPYAENQPQAVISDKGYLGLGKADPESHIHVERQGGNAELFLESKGVDQAGNAIDAFARLLAQTSNGRRQSTLLFGAELNFGWLPSRAGTGGGTMWTPLRLVGGPTRTDQLAVFMADVVLRNNDGQTMIHFDRQAGDISLSNADCAEDFDIEDEENVEPGSVMVLNDAGNLQLSRQAYDKRVAGVISGAGNLRPGLVLDRQQGRSNRRPISLVGKTFCKVDASKECIEVGDLLTTSDIAGFAMKALDPTRAFGAILGKALRPLRHGQGLIPILVTLQ